MSKIFLSRIFFLYESLFQAKVGDFGLARSGNEYESKAAKFPVKWTAPEAVMQKKFDIKSDVWAYGITMWEIFSLGCSPYPEWDNAKTIQELKRGYRMPPPDQVTYGKEDVKNAIYNVSYVTKKSTFKICDWIPVCVIEMYLSYFKFPLDHAKMLAQGANETSNLHDNP